MTTQTPPPEPSQRSNPSDMTIAQLLAEAKLIIHRLNAVNDELITAVGERDA